MVKLLSDNDLRHLQKAMERNMPLVLERNFRGITLVAKTKPAPEVWGQNTILCVEIEEGCVFRVKHCGSAEELRRYLYG